jgi:hypothetical protein
VYINEGITHQSVWSTETTLPVRIDKRPILRFSNHLRGPMGACVFILSIGPPLIEAVCSVRLPVTAWIFHTSKHRVGHAACMSSVAYDAGAQVSGLTF